MIEEIRVMTGSCGLEFVLDSIRRIDHFALKAAHETMTTKQIHSLLAHLFSCDETPPRNATLLHATNNVQPPLREADRFFESENKASPEMDWTPDQLHEIRFHLTKDWNASWWWVAHLIQSSDFLTCIFNCLDKSQDKRGCCNGSLDMLYHMPLNKQALSDDRQIDLLSAAWRHLLAVQEVSTACRKKTAIVANRLLLRFPNSDVKGSLARAGIPPSVLSKAIRSWIDESLASDQVQIASKWLLTLYWICIHPSCESIRISTPTDPSYHSQTSFTSTTSSSNADVVARPPCGACDRSLHEPACSLKSIISRIDPQNWTEYLPVWTQTRNELQWQAFFDCFYSIFDASEQSLSSGPGESALNPCAKRLLNHLLDSQSTMGESLLMPIPIIVICKDIMANNRLQTRDAVLHHLADKWSRCLWNFEPLEVAIAIGISILFDPKGAVSMPCEALISSIERGILLRNSGYNRLSRVLAALVSENFMRCRINLIKPVIDHASDSTRSGGDEIAGSTSKYLLNDFWAEVLRTFCADVVEDNANNAAPNDGDEHFSLSEYPRFVACVLLNLKSQTRVWISSADALTLTTYQQKWNQNIPSTLCSTRCHNGFVCKECGTVPEELDRLAAPLMTDGVPRQQKATTDEGPIYPPPHSFGESTLGAELSRTATDSGIGVYTDDLAASNLELLEIGSCISTQSSREDLDLDDQDDVLFDSIVGRKRHGHKTRQSSGASKRNTQRFASTSTLLGEIQDLHRQLQDPLYPAESLTHAVQRLKSVILPGEVNREGASLALNGLVDEVGKRISLQKSERDWVTERAVVFEIPKFLERLIKASFICITDKAQAVLPISSDASASNFDSINIHDSQAMISGVLELLSVGKELVEVLLGPSSHGASELGEATAVTLGLDLLAMWMGAALTSELQRSQGTSFNQLFNALHLPRITDKYHFGDNPLWRSLEQSILYPFNSTVPTRSRLLLNDGLRHAALVLAGVRPFHGGTTQTLPQQAKKLLCIYCLPMCRSIFKSIEKSLSLHDPKNQFENGPLALLIQTLPLFMGFGGSSIRNLDLLMGELEETLASFGRHILEEPLIRRALTLLAGTVSHLVKYSPHLKSQIPRSLILRLRLCLSLAMESPTESREAEAAAGIMTSIQRIYTMH